MAKILGHQPVGAGKDTSAYLVLGMREIRITSSTYLSGDGTKTAYECIPHSNMFTTTFF